MIVQDGTESTKIEKNCTKNNKLKFLTKFKKEKQWNLYPLRIRKAYSTYSWKAHLNYTQINLQLNMCSVPKTKFKLKLIILFKQL